MTAIKKTIVFSTELELSDYDKTIIIATINYELQMLMERIVRGTRISNAHIV